MPPASQPSQDIVTDTELILTVQLPMAQSKQRDFLRRVQAALGTEYSLGSLPPGPGDGIFMIPDTAADQLKHVLGVNDADLEAQLRSWGALTVNALQADSYFALVVRGGATTAGAPPPDPAPKLSNAGKPKQFKASSASPLPKFFSGPFDWNLGPRGANVAAAWEMFAGEPGHADRLPWKDIRIGHIDTGYTEHAALGWAAGSSMTVDVASGKDYFEDPPDADPRDEWVGAFRGHGTRISGAFAGYLANAPGRPFYGAAPGVKVIPYRVTDTVIVNHLLLRVKDAIREAVEDGCHVINISLGSTRKIFELSDALDFAYERGVIVCCAAGQVYRKVIYPGRYNRCVTMGGVGPDFKPWASSAVGKYVDLCGPADRIRRVKAEQLPKGQAAQNIETKDDGDGTSYATATCSGIAALWLAWHGVATLQNRYSGTGAWQIPAAFKKLLRATASRGAWPEGSTDYGSGVLNAAALLAAPLPESGSLVMALPAAADFDPND